MNQSLIKTTDNGIMKFTKLTAVSGNILAEVMEVEHFNLMRTIKRVMNYEKKRESQPSVVKGEILHIEEEKDPNFKAVFKEWEYERRGRKYRTYIMNEDALYLVIANSKGQKAHELKVWFKSEFNSMREERSSREHSKQGLRPMTKQIKRLQEKLYEEESGAAPHIYPTISKQIHRAATGRPMPKGGMDHGLLTSAENDKVTELREDVNYLIEENLADGFKGRDIKNKIREMLREEDL